jgi:hypothetical protein
MAYRVSHTSYYTGGEIVPPSCYCVGLFCVLITPSFLQWPVAVLHNTSFLGLSKGP